MRGERTGACLPVHLQNGSKRLKKCRLRRDDLDPRVKKEYKVLMVLTDTALPGPARKERVPDIIRTHFIIGTRSRALHAKKKKQRNESD